MYHFAFTGGRREYESPYKISAGPYSIEYTSSVWVFAAAARLPKLPTMPRNASCIETAFDKSQEATAHTYTSLTIY